MNEIKVSVVKYPDRRALVLRYTCPLTGKHKTKSAKTTKQSEAEKAAGKWESELREGRYRLPSKITFAEFRERYAKEKLASLAESTAWRVEGIFDAIGEIINPLHLRDLTAERISHYQSKLRDRELREDTIAAHLCHLKAALRWAARMGMIHQAPVIERPKRAKGECLMKGRPITLEEFERMLDKVEAGLMAGKRRKPKSAPKRFLTEGSKAKQKARQLSLAADCAPRWRHMLRGLWLSGLRLGESMVLSWDEGAKLSVDLLGEYPMLRIRAEAEKGHKDRFLPIAPDFAEFLLETPESERGGFVFNPLSPRGWRNKQHQVCQIIRWMGQAAGVIVNRDEKTGKVKHASAHDLRRSFGERWASKVMPQVLKELMRHESIETTLRYYVGRNAQTTAKVLWDAYKPQKSNTSGNSRHSDSGNTPVFCGKNEGSGRDQ